MSFFPFFPFPFPSLPSLVILFSSLLFICSFPFLPFSSLLSRYRFSSYILLFPFLWHSLTSVPLPSHLLFTWLPSSFHLFPFLSSPFLPCSFPFKHITYFCVSPVQISDHQINLNFHRVRLCLEVLAIFWADLMRVESKKSSRAIKKLPLREWSSRNKPTVLWFNSRNDF